MIYALHLSMIFMMFGITSPDAPNWAKFLVTLLMFIFYTVAILLWERHLKKVNELEQKIKELKEATK